MCPTATPPPARFSAPGASRPALVMPAENAGPLGPPRVPGAPATPRQTLTAAAPGTQSGKLPIPLTVRTDPG
jgi:hypothetical protein